MLKIFKCLTITFVFFLVSVTSCSKKEKKLELPKTECEQIKDIVTDCLGLYRGALKYVSSCGNISLVEIESLDTCKEILDHIENKD